MVLVKVGVMGRLEDVHLAVAAIEGWDAQPNLRITESAISQDFCQYARQRSSVVTVPEASPQSSPFALGRSPRTFPSGREDFAPTLDVDVKQFGSREAGRQAERNDSSGRRAGDEVEISCHRSVGKIVMLQIGEERRGKDPADSTAVDGQNAELSVLGPRQRYAPLSQRAGGALQVLVSAIHWCFPLSGLRMPPPARPFSSRQPAFVASQPVDRPGNDGASDRKAGVPFASVWIIQAEKWQPRAVYVRIVVRYRFGGILASLTQQRIGHHYPGLGHFGKTSIWFSVVRQENLVGLTQRADSADPGNLATGAMESLELRPFLPHALTLIPCRQSSH